MRCAFPETMSRDTSTPLALNGIELGEQYGGVDHDAVARSPA